ncbi:hypothetical protein BGX26_002049 [Mortierella sp. AD094]|nr:hypothetical protein BGX26_002049 [Mortierella sp. AD094]
MDISESEWRPFAPALQGRIKTFSTKNSTFTTGSESFYKSIKPYWSETLEIIRIRRDATIEDLDIQLILTSCPNLKTFSAFINTSGRRDRRMPAASGLTVQRYIRSRWGQNDWVCLKLENLELALFDDRTGLVWEYEEMGVDTKVPQEEEAASALELFYEQLGQLTKLQHLRLGWRTVVYHFRSHLDLSIRNGLTHLEGLKDLRVLDVGCIRELKIGQKEVEWMADNWPKLKRLKGLFAKETVNYDRSIEVDFETAHDAIPRADLDKANEQGYIQWLHEKRPHIIPISPFDLFHIIDLIGLHLSKMDCANCTLVCKAFNRNFKPLLWRNITCDQSNILYALDRKPPLHCKDAVAANGHLIRKLDISEFDYGGTLNMVAGPALPCTNLRELNISVDKHSQLGMVMDLVEKNPLLHSCHILTHRLGGIKPLKRVIQVIWRHQALVHLTLQGHYDLGVNSYRTLLQCLPSTLKSLELHWRIDSRTKTIPYIRNVKWRDSYPNLRSVSMAMENAHEQKVTLPFLKRCPVLESIKIMDRSSRDGQATDKLIDLLGNAQLFPRLTDISWYDATLDESDWQAFIPSMRGRIKSFSADFTEFDLESDSSFVRSFVPCWSSTLEVVRFQRHFDLSSKDIQLILTSCANLKTFSVFAACHDESVVTSLSGLHVASLNPDTSDSTDWVCLQLENLELAFTDFDSEEYDEWEDVDEPLTLDNLDLNDKIVGEYPYYEPGAKDVERIYKQLGRLTKLRYLRVGWIYPEYPDEPLCGVIDFSLRDGLRHLSGLKQLEVLDLSCLEDTGILKAEMKWMEQNWPKLRWLKGIEEKENVDFHGQMMVDFEKVTYPENSPDMRIIATKLVASNPKRLELPYNWGQQLCKTGSFLWDPQFFSQLTEISSGSLILGESEWTPLSSGMRSRIKALTTNCVQIQPSPSDFSKAITTHWADTIVVIHLESQYYISSPDIELILSTCSKLKSFAVTNGFATHYRHGPRAWHHEGHDDNTAGWVCLEIERLELMIQDYRETDDDSEADSLIYQENEERTINGIRRSRLGYLDGLKDLRVLDGHFERLKVGQMEIKWMVKN